MLETLALIENKLATLTAFSKRVHHKPVSTKKPMWEVRYNGARRDARGYRHSWEVWIWASLYHDPRAQTRNRQRTEQVVSALIEVAEETGCIILRDIEADVAIPDETDVRNVNKPLAFAISTILVEESDSRG